MRHCEPSCGQLIPIGATSPMLIGYNAGTPGVYFKFDATTLAATEFSFVDALKVDVSSTSASLDADGVTYIGALCWTRLLNARSLYSFSFFPH